MVCSFLALLWEELCSFSGETLFSLVLDSLLPDVKLHNGSVCYTQLVTLHRTVTCSTFFCYNALLNGKQKLSYSYEECFLGSAGIQRNFKIPRTTDKPDTRPPRKHRLIPLSRTQKFCASYTFRMLDICPSVTHLSMAASLGETGH